MNYLINIIDFCYQKKKYHFLKKNFSKSLDTFIDVGAHHPMRFSNTYLFYKKKWKGINIDPLPGSMKLFNKLRPRDINLELGV